MQFVSGVTDPFSGRSATLARLLPARSRAVVACALSGILLTLGMTWHIGHLPGLYSSQVEVVFLAPQSAVYPNTLAVSSDSIITTAGVVGRIIDPHTEVLASDVVTITGEGIRHGFWVQLPNTGGQNATDFSKPQLDVQAVGSTAAEVDSTMRHVLRRIRTTLHRLQAERGVTPNNAITTSDSPSSIPIFYDQGSRIRAMAATLLLGTGLTVGASAALRRTLAPRRPARRRPRPTTAPPLPAPVR